jgi:hypothetical protein
VKQLSPGHGQPDTDIGSRDAPGLHRVTFDTSDSQRDGLRRAFYVPRGGVDPGVRLLRVFQPPRQNYL